MLFRSERNYRPHVNCVKMTRDNKFLMAADLGMDHINVYRVNRESGKLTMVDIVRSDLDSAPRHIKMTKDGKFIYIVHELKNTIDLYAYEVVNDNPEFTRIATYPTLNEYHAGGSAASALNFSIDEHFLISSSAGDNSVILFEINHKDGTLNKKFCLPISGEYPKDVKPTSSLPTLL